MDKLLLQLLCVFSLIVVICSETENIAGKQSYDLNGLITNTARRYENSQIAKEHGMLSPFKYNGIQENAQFVPSSNLFLNSSKCLKDIVYTIENIKSQWAMKLFDSYGKPESGILQGNVKWVGSYDECVDVSASSPNSTNSTIGNFRGKYCTLTWSLKMGQDVPMPLGLSMGVCLPNSCSPEQLEEDVLQLLYVAGIAPSLNATNGTKSISLTCKPTERELNGPAIAVITLLSIFLALTFIGSSITAYKYIKRIVDGYRNTSFLEAIIDTDHLIQDESDVPDKRERSHDPVPSHSDSSNGVMQKLETFFTCFCIFTNGSKILNTNTSEGELLCIHGIRFLSMAWVILGHTYLFGIMQMKNLLTLMQSLDTFFIQIILQGFYSVDSFFVLSGFLLAYLAMNEFAKSNGSIAWPYFYIHRYIRLTPIYMVLLGFSATVYLYLGSGPYWPDGDIDKNCQDSWWKNLIYINNFYDQAESCMGWSWYLANDMQFFVISPLFLITLWRWPKIGYSLISVFMLACWSSNFYITYHFKLMAGVFNVDQAATASIAKFMDYFNKIYIKPYTRISPYLIGMVTGHLLYKRKEKNYPRHGLMFMCIGWAFSVGVGLTCVFVLYRQNPPLIGNCFYNALNRTGFALSLAWVIYACLVGQGGFVNRILSYKLFIPLSRLTYAAYLIHPMIITGYFSSLKMGIEFNHPMLVYLFLGFLVSTYALALPVALVLESPVITIEKWVRRSFTQPRKTETVN